MNFTLWRATCVIALCLLFANTVRAQGYHQLTINDFEGRPQANQRGVIAYTNCTIDFHYEASRLRGNFTLDFKIRLIMNKNRSWIEKSRISTREMMAEVLKHEQGHYIIAYLEQQEMLRILGQTRFDSNYQYQVKTIFNRIDAKYKQLNEDYDDDTQHMQNRVQQNSWDKFFRNRLAFMPGTEISSN